MKAGQKNKLDIVRLMQFWKNQDQGDSYEGLEMGG